MERCHEHHPAVQGLSGMSIGGIKGCKHQMGSVAMRVVILTKINELLCIRQFLSGIYFSNGHLKTGILELTAAILDAHIAAAPRLRSPSNKFARLHAPKVFLGLTVQFACWVACSNDRRQA